MTLPIFRQIFLRFAKHRLDAPPTLRYFYKDGPAIYG